MKRAIRWYDYITINIYYFALTTRSQILAPLVLPLLIQQFMGDELKGTYYGNIRLWALMVAVLSQALFGLLSDRNTSRFGRRRPYIFAGTIMEVIIMLAIGVIASTMSGAAGYWMLFIAYILSMLSSNASHAAAQALIPDLVPENIRGRFSGIKAFFELPLPLVFISFVVSKMIAAGNIWGGLLVLVAVLIFCMLLTWFIPEEPIDEPPFKLDWKPLVRLVLMTLAFTIIIFGAGALVKLVTQAMPDATPTQTLLVIGGSGLLAMIAAVVLGVWSSVKIGGGSEASKNPSFTWWVINRLAFLIGANNVSGFVLYFLQERFPELQGNAAAGPTSMLMLFVGVSILISSIPAGWVTDRVSKKLVILCSGIVAAAGTLLVSTSSGMTMLYVGGLLIGIAIGFFYSANWALGTQIIPKGQAGQFLGLSNLAGAGAGAIGAYIGGPIGDASGYVLLMSIYGVIFLVSSLALLGIREPKLTTITEG